MSAESDEIYAGIRSEAVRARTGKGWAEWFARLDRAGAANWPHKKIAVYLHDECDCGAWWSQMVTVGYEQARGLRVKHQTADGYSASASKTFAVPLSRLFAAWADPKTRARWLPDAARVSVRGTTKNKSLRFTWTDGEASVVVQFYPKGASKSQVTIERRKLSSEKQVQEVKAYWSAALVKLQALFDGAARSPRPRTLARAVRKK